MSRQLQLPGYVYVLPIEFPHHSLGCATDDVIPTSMQGAHIRVALPALEYPFQLRTDPVDGSWIPTEGPWILTCSHDWVVCRDTSVANRSDAGLGGVIMDVFYGSPPFGGVFIDFLQQVAGCNSITSSNHA